MRSHTYLSGMMIIGMAFGRTVSAHGQVLRQADVVGTWRHIAVSAVAWDSTTQALTPSWFEMVLTLRADSTFAAQAGYVVKSERTSGMSPQEWKSLFGAQVGRWALAADTLVMGPLLGLPRFTVARVGDTLTLRDLSVRAPDFGRAPENAWVLVDTTKPPSSRPTLPPPTLTPAALAGTWVATSPVYQDTVTDTVRLRADRTWTASAFKLGEAQAATRGTWDLGPGNTIVFLDALRQPLSGPLGRWRGNGAVKRRGQQLIPETNVYPIYTRVGDANR